MKLISFEGIKNLVSILDEYFYRWNKNMGIIMKIKMINSDAESTKQIIYSYIEEQVSISHLQRIFEIC